MSLVKWSTHSSYTTAITMGTTGVGLTGLASTNSVFGDDFNNETTGQRYQYADWDLRLALASASSASPYVRVWLLRSIDGSTSNYESGSTTVTPLRAPDLIFPTLLTSGQQCVSLKRQPFPSCRFKPLVQNETGYAFSSSGIISLCFSAYYDEIV